MKGKRTSQPTRTCACIIPFYNEGGRILRVLTFLKSLKQLHTIVCIDDGSSDNSFELIKKHFPEVTLLQNKKNQGKAAAIYKGLSVVRDDYVLLLDADLYNLSKREIEQGISYILGDPSIDMLIFRRKNELWSTKLIRGEVLFSGERILKRDDLNNIFNNKPKKFQIEAAINVYMMENRKNVYWVVSSGKSIPKIKKNGFVKGVLQDIEMSTSIITYMSYKNHIKSLLTFCTNEYKREKIPYERADHFFHYPYASSLIKKLLFSEKRRD